MRVLTVVLLAFVLVACQPPAPPQAADLAPVLDAVTALDDQLTVLTAEVDVLNARIVGLDESLRTQMTGLLSAATDLNALVRQPLDLSDVDLASIEVLFITTTADVLDFLLLAPGECPADLPIPRNAVRAGETAITVAWPAPTGVHCISSPAAEERPAFGTVVDVPAGAIASVALLPPTE